MTKSTIPPVTFSNPPQCARRRVLFLIWDDCAMCMEEEHLCASSQVFCTHATRPAAVRLLTLMERRLTAGVESQEPDRHCGRATSDKGAHTHLQQRVVVRGREIRHSPGRHISRCRACARFALACRLRPSASTIGRGYLCAHLFSQDRG